MIDGACPNITPEKIECAKNGFIILVSLIAIPMLIASLRKDFIRWKARRDRRD